MIQSWSLLVPLDLLWLQVKYVGKNSQSISFASFLHLPRALLTLPLHCLDFRQRAYIDKVMNGEISGSYLLLLGPKGSGKSSLLVESLIKSTYPGIHLPFPCFSFPFSDIFSLSIDQADGVAMMEVWAFLLTIYSLLISDKFCSYFDLSGSWRSGSVSTAVGKSFRFRI